MHGEMLLTFFLPSLAQGLTVIARSESDEAIHSFFAWQGGLLRFARNDVARIYPGRENHSAP
jgi:hypothetical protein